MITRRVAMLGLLGLGLLGLAGCDALLARMLGGNSAAPPWPNGPRIVDGRLFVPVDQQDFDATGLAIVYQRAGGSNALREDNPGDLPAAAHPTLFLPAIVRVTNLDNGRQAVIRMNERGPFGQDALIGLSPSAMALLDAPGTLREPGAGMRVRVTLLPAETASARAAYAARERAGRHLEHVDMPPL